MNENNMPVPGPTELEASQLELVVSEKTIGSLTTNAKQIRALVAQALPRYDIANYSTDDVAKAKADKALLNKAAKTLNDKRIEFEKEFMAPFGEFKSVVGDTVKIIKEAVARIDTIIKADEERFKDEKRAQVEQLAKDCGWDAIGVPLSKIWSDKWLNKSVSLKSVEKEISETMATITKDLETLQSFAEDYDVLEVRYKENLNLQEAVRYANQLKEQREEKVRMAQAAVVTPTPSPAETHEEPKEEEKSHHDIEDAEADAADAFADIFGMSAGKPKDSVYPKIYEVFATDIQFEALEQYLRDAGLGFNVNE